MNVAFEPWIPVVTTSGERTLASLIDVLCEGEQFADLAVRPHERVSLMRLFICIAHAALDGPKDYPEWLDVPNKLPEATRRYLSKWKDSFELFHAEKPWLQVKDLEGVKDDAKISPVALLDFELSTGNNPTLHDHSGSMAVRQVNPSRIALTLLTFQNFSSGGGSPIAKWNNTRTSQVGNPDAPCLSQSMAHCLMRGKLLVETIHLNMPLFETVTRTYRGMVNHKADKKKREYAYTEFENVGIGRPVWECFPGKPDATSDEAVNATKTYLGRLVPVSRWIRLIDRSKMYCCNGFKYDTFKDGFPAEPSASVRVTTKKDAKGVETFERAVVRIDPSKALWRELSALLVKRIAFGLGGPLAIENTPYDSEFDFHVCAMTRDQASMDIAIESVFHITPAFQSNLSSYQAEITFAERISRKLGASIEEYRKIIDGSWEKKVEKSRDKWELKAKLHSVATIHYWTTVEKNRSLLLSHIEAIGTDDPIPTRETWRKMLFSTACDAYRVACGQATPRQMRASVKGWRKLTYKKDEPKTDETTSTEENS